MTNYGIDELMNQNEGIININLVNGDNGKSCDGLLPVYLDNTLGDIIDECGRDIQINFQEDLEFSTAGHEHVTDRSVTVQQMGLTEGSTLVVRTKAGTSEKASEKEFAITVKHQESGANVKAKVSAGMTLGNVLNEYAGKIGIDASDSKVIFRNQRTEETTSDKAETVGAFGLYEGDVLTIQDNGGVA